MPTIGDTSTVSTTQSSTTNHNEEVRSAEKTRVTITNEASVVEASTRGESQGSLLGKKLTPPAINITASKVPAKIIEASTRDELQDSLLGEASTNQQPKNIAQVEATTTADTLQESNTSEWLIPREEFELKDDPAH